MRKSRTRKEVIQPFPRHFPTPASSLSRMHMHENQIYPCWWRQMKFPISKAPFRRSAIKRKLIALVHTRLMLLFHHKKPKKGSVRVVCWQSLILRVTTCRTADVEDLKKRSPQRKRKRVFEEHFYFHLEASFCSSSSAQIHVPYVDLPL